MLDLVDCTCQAQWLEEALGRLAPQLTAIYLMLEKSSGLVECELGMVSSSRRVQEIKESGRITRDRVGRGVRFVADADANAG